jgi:hypothetical protein
MPVAGVDVLTHLQIYFPNRRVDMNHAVIIKNAVGAVGAAELTKVT